MGKMPRRRIQWTDSGMSLIEVVVASVVLGILSAVVLGIILQTQQASVDNRARIAAANLAAREIDILREEFGRTDTAPHEIADKGTVVNPHQFPGGVDGGPLVVDGKEYTVTRDVQWNHTGDTGASLCDGGSNVPYPTLGVRVTVTWPHMGSTKPVVSEAQLAPDKGSGIQVTASFVVVEVVDSEGKPNPGRAVTVTGPSEVRVGKTDSAGCAVLEVSPAESGTAYTAALGDTGYVDIARSNTPSKPAGTLKPGELSSVINFAYDRAASLTVRVLASAGGPLVADGDVAGSEVSVVVFGSSGAEATFPAPLSGAVTTVDGLWPTTYGAYFGDTAPGGGYPTVQLPSGGSGSLDVVLSPATGTVTTTPPGTTVVYAVPAGRPCTDPGRHTVTGGFALVPGEWAFYASGPAFDCAPGPVVELGAGENDPVAWASTTLKVTGVPAAGSLYAVSRAKVDPNGMLTTCPNLATYGGVAIPADGAKGASGMEIAPGDWYVFRADAAGACLGVPLGSYSVVVDYGGLTSFAWNETYAQVNLTVNGATPLGGSQGWRVIVSKTAGLSCTNSNTGTGAVPLTTIGNSAIGTVNAGSWYVYRHRTVGGSGNRCVAETGNPLRAFPGASQTYTLTWNVGVSAP